MLHIKLIIGCIILTPFLKYVYLRRNVYTKNKNKGFKYTHYN